MSPMCMCRLRPTLLAHVPEPISSMAESASGRLVLAHRVGHLRLVLDNGGPRTAGEPSPVAGTH